jgi:tetratricopeptide (TPR) repeat protein
MPRAAEIQDEGLAHFRADRLAEAGDSFAAAAEAFVTQDEPLKAAEARNNLCVVRLAEQNWEAALAAVSGTPETFAAAGDRLRHAQALSNLAAAHAGAGHLDEAARLYEQAIDGFTEPGEAENRAACWKALSAVQIKQDNKLQAMASMRSGLNLTPKLTPREKTLRGLLDKAIKMMGGH